MRGFSKKATAIFLSLFLVLVQLLGTGTSAFAAGKTAAAAPTEYKVKKIYSGFQLTSIKEVPEVNSSVMIFNHIKTGAKLMYVKNNDVDRVFSIGFRTPPSDDTGVNHIIEHSVLDGSKNYPVRSTISEMLKQSLGTFINAMTAPDFTVFPVSSTSEKDLQNLMSVYLDAVFYPNLLNDPNIFKQEAWRYQLDSKDAKPVVNGVVYNEMSSDYTNPQLLLRYAVNETLFPNSIYQWNAGGDPAVIPNLTREKYLATYKKNYTPSNSYIYLYGKLDIGKYLDYIDKNYLGKMKKTAVDTAIKLQEPLSKLPDKVVPYPVAANSDTKGKAYLALGFLTGTANDKKLSVGMDYLGYLLMGSDNAPLKKALLESGIAQNYSYTWNTQPIQPVFYITAENTDASAKAKFKKVITDELKKIAANGFDKNYLAAALAQFDFSYRYSKLAPMKGMNLGFNAIQSWIKGYDPTLYFETEKTMQEILAESGKQYFEKLVNTYLLSNTQSAMTVLKPVAGLQDTNAAALSKKLEAYKKKIGSKGVEALVKDTAAIKKWQTTPESKKSLATIPKLSVKDIQPEVADYSMDVEKYAGMEIISHSANLNGISTVSLYFDTSKVPQEKLHYLKLLASLLGNVDTKALKYADLANVSALYTGGVYFNASSIRKYNNANDFKPVMAVSLSTLDYNIPTALELVDEIIHHSLFEDKTRIKQLIDQNKAILQQTYASGTGSASLEGLQAYMSESGRYTEALGGLSYYIFLQDLSQHFDERWKDLSANLSDVMAHAFNKSGLIASQCGEANGTELFKTGIKGLVDKLSDSRLPAQAYRFTAPEKNHAYALPATVQTIIQGGDFIKEGYAYSGKMEVVSKILYSDYLWRKVRTDGGAYGAGISFSPDGNIYLQSICDPKLSETLDAFKGAVKFLKDFQATPEEMEGYIIGAISQLTNLKTLGPLYEGMISESLYLSGRTEEDLLNIQKEILSTTAQDIRDYGRLLEKVLNQNIYFVEGSESSIQSNKSLFNKIEVLGN